MQACRVAINAVSRAFITRLWIERHRSILLFRAQPKRVDPMVSDAALGMSVACTVFIACYATVVVCMYGRCYDTRCESSMPRPSRHLRSHRYHSVVLRRRDVASQFLCASPESLRVRDVLEGRSPLIRCRLDKTEMRHRRCNEA